MTPRTLLVTILSLVFVVGCRSTQQFQAPRDEVFDAAIASVPMTMGGMQLTACDRAAGTFEGVMADPFGNVYLRGRAIARSDESGVAGTLVEIDCWQWTLATLFLIPFQDAAGAEGEFLGVLEEQLRERSSDPADPSSK